MNPLIHNRILIAGGGMAGISLAWHLSKAHFEGEILIFEKHAEERKKRTWSFWQKGSGDWDDIASAVWNRIRLTDFQGNERVYSMAPYRYLTINGEHFYAKTLGHLNSQPNVRFIHGEVSDIKVNEKEAQLCSGGKKFTGDFVFDSILKATDIKESTRAMWQHFYGYIVEFDADVFDPQIPDFMNFNTGVEDDCHFIYILPFSKNRALIEYTIFSPDRLKEEAYVLMLESWIKQHYADKKYRILDIEFNAIPMTDAYFNPQPSRRHIKIGTAGGYTNPATGYTFYLSQKRLISLAKQIIHNQWPNNHPSFWHKRFNWYQATLLEVLSSQELRAHQVFTDLFHKNKTTDILEFLNNESSLASELRIMSSTNMLVFGKAGLKVALDALKRK
jgi:lycopene beta-cyclase